MGDGKVERRYSDGTRIVSFRNGTEKELAPDGTSIVRFVNGDVKQVWCRDVTPRLFAEALGVNHILLRHSLFLAVLTVPAQTFPATGKVVYYYAEARTTHTTAADGTETFEFPSGQVSIADYN